jgi:hypothetical protein
MHHRWIVAGLAVLGLGASTVAGPARATDVDGVTMLVGAGPANATETAFVTQGCDGSVTPENGVDGWVIELPEGAGKTLALLAAPILDASVSAAFYTADCTAAGVGGPFRTFGIESFTVPPSAHWVVLRAHDGMVWLGSTPSFA